MEAEGKTTEKNKISLQRFSPAHISDNTTLVHAPPYTRAHARVSLSVSRKEGRKTSGREVYEGQKPCAGGAAARVEGQVRDTFARPERKKMDTWGGESSREDR